MSLAVILQWRKGRCCDSEGQSYVRTVVFQKLQEKTVFGGEEKTGLPNGLCFLGSAMCSSREIQVERCVYGEERAKPILGLYCIRLAPALSLTGYKGGLGGYFKR